MQKGEIIYLEFEAWLNDKTELLETTKEEVAKKENKYNEKANYKPIPTIVGAGRLIKGLDDHILQAEVEKEYEVEILPIDAYGERNPKDVKVYSIRELLRKGIKPEIGKEIIIENRVGTIVRGGIGRVLVDFNHPFAGKKLFYKYKIVKKVEDLKEKIATIIEIHYGNSTTFEINVEGENAEIKLPKGREYDQDWFYNKVKVVSDLWDYVNLKKVRFIEEHLKKEDKKEEEKI